MAFQSCIDRAYSSGGQKPEGGAVLDLRDQNAIGRCVTGALYFSQRDADKGPDAQVFGLSVVSDRFDDGVLWRMMEALRKEDGK